jgi:unsaturated rhamnogalacturonyl hydrolase
METSAKLTSEQVIAAAKRIIERYLSRHGEQAYTYRPFIKGGIYRREDYRYKADLNELMPEAPLGSYSYLWATKESAEESTLRFALIPYGPTRIFVNGVLSGRSDIFTERWRSKMIFDLPLKAGTNDIVLECENTSGGFGGEFGTWVGKLDYYFLTPDASMEGVWYTQPTHTPLTKIDRPALDSLRWNKGDSTSDSASWNLQDIYPEASGDAKAVVVTSLDLGEPRTAIVETNASLFIDGKQVGSQVELGGGVHQIVAHAPIKESFNLRLTDEQSGEALALINPVLGKESRYRILVAGPFDTIPTDFAIQYTKPFESTDGLSFWRLEGRDTYLRMYNDNELFGHWNYPLGVTLYGLVEMERLFRPTDERLSDRINALLLAHIQKSIDTYAYAQWDKETLGGATAVHHLMTSLDSLDDCGSFGATVLEIAKDHQVEGYELLADVVGQYISEEQPRLPSGAFYRTGLMHEFHENTMWVDDLYMSVPFLIRYAALRDESCYIDDAVTQFDGFFDLLYMEEAQLMSHVYDFEREIATGIPWGRGNGWVLFSLSELLAVMDDSHPARLRILERFRALSAGFLRCQDADGMFHQVLDMPSSYQESSCTAMFAAACARGIKAGWLEEDEVYKEAIKRAVSGLLTHAIDKEGRVLGVCRGSEFSCSRHYYVEELLARIDDTHGIGIILLALGEYERLF